MATVENPLVTVERRANALHLAALNKAALDAGLTPAMALADARARLPGLAAHPADPHAEAALLKKIARWCERYTPLTALDPPDGLFLDISGCAHLFGGEAELAKDLTARLAKSGLAARIAIAPTPGAAFALSRHGGGSIKGEAGGEESRAALAPLPLSALRLEENCAAALARAGLKRIGQLFDVPRAPLAARFGDHPLRRLDQALGTSGEPVSPLRPPPAFIAEQRFAEPLTLDDALALSLERLAGHLQTALEKRGAGARLLLLSLFAAQGGEKGGRLDIALRTARPLRAAPRIHALLRERLAGLALPERSDEGFDLVRLSAPLTAPLEARQESMAATRGTTGEEDLARLIDRLTARFGAARLLRLLPRDSHLPERAMAARPALETLAQDREGPGAWFADAFGETNDGPARPLRLLECPEAVEAMAEVPDGPPLRFSWRRLAFHVARAEGPERIAPEWWRQGGLKGEAPPTRDYYRIEDDQGRRFWLYREGLYERETARPRWFLHGIFA